MNILLSAFSFEPTESSEPGVAWRFAQMAAEDHNVWILTADFPTTLKRTRLYLASHPHRNIHVVPFWPKGVLRSRNGEFVNIQYWFWQRQVLAMALKLHQAHNFSLVHQVTFSRYWTPSSLCYLPIPYIWGPVGSAESTPASFIKTLPFRSRVQNAVRNLSRTLSEFDPLLRKCAREAAITFATTSETLTRVRKLGAKRAELLPQVFLSTSRLSYFSSLPAPAQHEPLRILSIGRNLYWKGFQYGLEAAALLKQRGIPFTYTIVGQGPFARHLQSKVLRLALSDDVVFIRRFDGDIGEALKDCHVLLHPALHETFGNVCLEALAAGRPVICLDTGGPAMQVTPNCGLAAQTKCPKEAVLMIAEKLANIATQPALWKSMSDAAKARAQEVFSLERVKCRVLQAYADVQNVNSYAVNC